MFATSNYRRTLFEALLDARRVHGGVAPDRRRHRAQTDHVQRSSSMRSTMLGESIARDTRRGEIVGLMLPNALAAVAAFFGLQARGRVAAMLNYTLGATEPRRRRARRAQHPARIYTSRRFVQAAKLERASTGCDQTADDRVPRGLARAGSRPR